ncbi:MAG: hypothetical protein KGO50_05065 [Myxococcales bacterium]|nr:hypothetical protein [Myxococcales bacterium]
MSRFSLVFCVAVTLILHACGGSRAAEEGQAAVVTPRPAGVMLVGILGDEHCESTSFAPSVLAEGLRRADPDAVVLPISAALVEQARACPDPICTQTLRISNHVNDCWFWDGVLPWLREVPEVTVLSFELMTSSESSDLRAWIDATGGEPSARSYFRAQASLMMAELQAAGGYESPGWLQSDLYASLSEEVDRWLSYYAEEAMGAGGQLRVLDRMTERALERIREADPSGRTLVLVPARSRWYLEQALATTPELRRLPAAEIFPYVVSSP